MSETTQITPKGAELLPTSVSPNDLLTTYEAAQYLRLSASTLNKYVCSAPGRQPSILAEPCGMPGAISTPL